MVYCTKCGKSNPDTAKFCTACGAALIVTTLQPSGPVNYPVSASPSKNIATWWIIGIVAILGIGIGAYFLFFNEEKKVSQKLPDPPDTTAVSVPITTNVPTVQTEGLSYTDLNGLLVYRSDCFIIVTGSFVEERFARDYVNTMKNEGHPNSGYLWIPDYPSLSGKQFYATFIGPYQSYEECKNNLRTLKVNSRFWYGKKVSYNPEQIEIRIK